MKTKKKKILFITGFIAMLLGISVRGVFGWKRISREIEKAETSERVRCI